MVHCIWCIVYGAVYMVHCVWCIVYGALYMVHCVWCIVYGALYMVHCVWCIVYGALYRVSSVLPTFVCKEILRKWCDQSCGASGETGLGLCGYKIW